MYKMKQVVITADSGSDIPLELAEKHGIGVVPLTVVVGDGNYTDGVDITPREIYSMVESGSDMPKTASVTPTAHGEFFKRYTSQGYAVVHVSLSSGISSTYQNAVIAAQELEDVFVVDSLSLHTGIDLLLLLACDLRDQGLDAGAIASRLEQARDKVRTTFIVTQMDYLVKGGRCSSLAALGANILSIRPSIDMAQGQLKVGKKYRGKTESCFLSYAKDCMAQADSIDPRRVFVSHSGGVDQQTIDKVVKQVTDMVAFQEVYVAEAGCTISSHCGPGTLAVIYMNK